MPGSPFTPNSGLSAVRGTGCGPLGVLLAGGFVVVRGVLVVVRVVVVVVVVLRLVGYVLVVEVGEPAPPEEEFWLDLVNASTPTVAIPSSATPTSTTARTGPAEDRRGGGRPGPEYGGGITGIGGGAG
ncbi:Na+-transporting methylmalonyl-CoA/oxaloacetate decarboxylase gamma subunit [Kutzneria viridogrisea]|uniref:Na+-transporting methylmalonyl-CoA/oxaloacetate decarboxylase gamma subunit n=1 Tax=Kutzneria viridogrisea TaxID=47990 RepID=A0ABR6BT51_9PSEU|nr:Na+-transporting methylmalonyl-CoA/oxaloacetate decarboxylase gamma subunit [Kutzneria viridogrisea]